ncbi:MAG TPA: hypothetical protein VGM73_08425 [Candidatus Didemnitutus sp.]|jgi:hypothetical protein
MKKSDEPTGDAAPAVPGEMRYSLTELLQAVQLERNAPTFAMEKLDQGEITKLYQKSRTRRVLRPKK